MSTAAIVARIIPGAVRQTHIAKAWLRISEFSVRTAAGSLAWEISAGELWGLDGEGKWINQTTSEVYDPAPDEETETEAIEEAE